MDTLSGIKTFRQVVESGSFVAAAKRLQLSTATVSKRIMDVEQRLGVRLLNRNSRKLSLTDPGRLYFGRCRTFLDELHATELELGSLGCAPRGTLRITLPSFAAGGQLSRLLAEYGRRYLQGSPRARPPGVSSGACDTVHRPYARQICVTKGRHIRRFRPRLRFIAVRRRKRACRQRPPRSGRLRSRPVPLSSTLLRTQKGQTEAIAHSYDELAPSLAR